ncbi:MAG: class I SAM-dependent methyltransferase [Erysipelotrichaceae bacterium]
MNHYFTTDSRFSENRKKISFRFLGVLETFISSDGVFSKDGLDYGSRVLLETVINQDISGEVADLGCGIGVIGILLKKYHPQINLTMIDVNENAVQLSIENSQLYGQNNQSIVSFGLNNLEGKTFDYIFSNPPIRTGKKVIYQLFEQSLNALNPNGRLIIVIRKQQGAQSALKYLEGISDRVEILNKDGGYWIISAQKSLK